MSYKVYLAGAVSGLTFDEAIDWREYAKDGLAYPEDVGGFDLVGYSPMRAKEYLSSRGVLSGHPDAYNDQVLSSAKGILTRDAWDCATADLILVNLLGAKTVSIGTVMEIGMGHAYRKPIVIAMEEDNVHQHVMLSTAAGWITDDLDYAIELVRAILLPDRIKARA